MMPEDISLMHLNNQQVIGHKRGTAKEVVARMGAIGLGTIILEVRFAITGQFLIFKPISSWISPVKGVVA